MSQTFLESFRTCIHACLNVSGLEARAYRHPFISCIVLNITFRSLSFMALKTEIYS
ncbi:MAG: hypothetical protein WCG25_06625 [bacterium]